MADVPQKKGRGCFFYGCLTMILVLVGVIAGIFFGTRQAVKYAVRNYTTNAPAKIPNLDVSSAEAERLARALQNQATQLMRGSNTAPLTLSEGELNVLLWQVPQLEEHRKYVYLRPSGTQLEAQVSLPLDQIPWWRSASKKLLSRELENRYFNGTALLRPGLSNGAVSLTLQDLKVNGQSMPSNFTAHITNFNFTTGVGTNPQLEAVLGHVEKIDIRDSKVQLFLKKQSAPSQ